MPCSDVNNNSYGGNVMSDRYIPKVGDEGFEWSNQLSGGWTKCGEVIADTDKQIVCLEVNGYICVLSKTHDFRPVSVKTKADVEFEQLARLILDSYRRCTGPDYCAKNIQKAGFTIPKKVKRSELARAIWNALADVTELQANHAAGKVCEFLLGDLVEDEA